MRFLILHIFILSGFLLFGQTANKVSKSQFQIGEQCTLTYQFTYVGKKEDIKFQGFSQVISCSRRVNNSILNTGEKVDLEIISFQDSSFSNGTTLTWRASYLITAWDTGNFVIPPVNLIFKDSIIDFLPLLVSVSSPKLEEGKEIYGIKETFVDIEPEYISWLKKYWWILLILIALLSAFLVYRWRKKRANATNSTKVLSLKDKTILALEGLEKSRMWEKEMLKEHYIELSFIFRSYLSAQFQLNFLEKTTFQTALMLQKLNLSKDTIQTIKLILDYSDMVKFAKSKPELGEILKNIAQVKQIVAETSPLNIENVE